MPASVPVFFFSLPEGGAAICDQESAERYVGENYRSDEVLEVVFTNFWGTKMLVAVGAAIGADGVAFLTSPFACLACEELSRSSEDLGAVQGSLSSLGLPNVVGEFGPELQALRDADLGQAFSQAEVRSRVDEDAGDVEAFCDFVVSLRAKLEQSIRSGQEVVYLAPQP